ncbi:MAG: FHA domain-containing protein [Planctomycetaceae bacterium]
MSDAQKPLDNPTLYLEIVKGSTRFPNRPVYEGVFLIGSGSNCDLRIGGPDTPAVHSVVRAEKGDVHIESLSRKPVLRVNGSPCERVELRNGDRVQIGSIQMVAKFQSVPVAPVMPVEEAGPADLASMSAEQLIGLLEQDLALVEDASRHESNGAELLLEAARRTAGASAPEVQEDDRNLRIVDPDEELHDSQAEAEQLIVALNRIADDLNTRVDHIRRKEEVYTDAADDLLAMQNRFADLLERVLQRLDEKQQPPQRRSA